jgi:hypothetical protein
LPVKGTPAGSAGSANDAPAKRLGAGWEGAVGGSPDGVAVAEGRADGVAFAVAGSDAAGEHAVNKKRKAAVSQRALGVRVAKTFGCNRSCLDAFMDRLPAIGDGRGLICGTRRPCPAFCRI